MGLDGRASHRRLRALGEEDHRTDALGGGLERDPGARGAREVGVVSVRLDPEDRPLDAQEAPGVLRLERVAHGDARECPVPEQGQDGGAVLARLAVSPLIPYTNPTVGDLDLDGTQEIVYGGTVFDPQGNMEWSSTLLGTETDIGHWSAILDVDGDPTKATSVAPSPSKSAAHGGATLSVPADHDVFSEPSAS